jgi:hypothetical protein
MYAQNGSNLYVNLFINGSAAINIGTMPVEIIQQNNYPWNGELAFTINPKKATAFNLLVRIPGWALNKAIPSNLYNFAQNSISSTVIKINGQPVDYTMQKGYASINRTWKKNDRVEVNLAMEVRRVVASENIKDDIGKVALQRGPLVYCAEWVDNNGKTSNIIMPAKTIFTTEYQPGLLNGVTVVKANVPAVIVSNNETVATVQQTFTAIRYYSWANRGKGEMMIWFPEQVKDIDLIVK